MAVERWVSQAINGFEPQFKKEREKILRGNLLNVWQLYKDLLPDREVLGWLTTWDELEERKNLFFPDFFHAVDRFIFPYPDRTPNYHQNGVEGWISELDETFGTLCSNETNRSFLERHSELKYLGKLSPFAWQGREFAKRFPFIRGIEMKDLWSIVDYNRLRGNIDFYAQFDEVLKLMEGIGTLFEKDSAHPGDFMIYLLPYGKKEERLRPYLPLLKHGDIIGFAQASLAKIDENKYLAITSLQTDLLRKDHVIKPASETSFWDSEIKKNEDGRYTVPGSVSGYYLGNYSWAHRLVSAIEEAVVETKDQLGIRGIIIPTISTYGAKDFRVLSASSYANGLYESFPSQREYQRISFPPVFPLTERFEKGIDSGSGEWWLKSID